MDLKLIIPNLIGVLLCAGQIFSYYYFYFKLHGKPPAEPKSEKELYEVTGEQNYGKEKLIETDDQRQKINESASTE